ncbi:MAG: efflux RND transporter periplasmic adaptor subunit [Dokdonella sp.]
MRPLVVVLAATVGLAVGAVSTWLVLRTAPPVVPTKANNSVLADKNVLYWYDPMVPAQHFDKPGKSPFMDMQLVPKVVGQGADSTASGVVQIDPRQLQNLGLRTARAQSGALTTTVSATGTVAFDERAVSVVQARSSGIVERLDVRAPMTVVKRGETLLTLIAPDWTAAQEEYLSLRRAKSAGLEQLQGAARRRLLLLGMGEGQIRSIERSEQAQTRIAITAPRDGVVTELSVREGAGVSVGAPLLHINGLDTVWVNASIPETQIGRVSSAASVVVELPAFPGERFEARIDALLPDLDAATRTQTARLALPNPSHRIAPGMFARVGFATSNERQAGVLVPTDAVIATGARSVVIVVEDEGHLRAQEVRIGEESGGKTEVIEGLKDGDSVVLSGQFLIDSEASLSGTLARLGGGADAGSAQGKADDSESEVYRAQGQVERVEGTRWTIATDAIPSLQMGAMTMTFDLATQAHSGDVRPGQRVSFAFVRHADGMFAITAMSVLGETPNPVLPKSGAGGKP